MSTGWYAQQQMANAPSGRADGQCPECGAFRLDGKPPTVHRTRPARCSQARLAPEGGFLNGAVEKPEWQ